MKTKCFIAAAAAVVFLAGCSNNAQSKTAETSAASVLSTVSAAPSSSLLELTANDLEKYNGKDGNPAYVAVDGVIYDVTNIPEWANGEHKNGLTAGKDLTDEIKKQSPHGLSVLEKLTIVGKLI